MINPLISLVTDVLGGLAQMIGVIVGYLIAFFKQVYEILVLTINKIYELVTFITGAFPYDDSKKTLMLSIVFFFMVIGMIMITSETSFFEEGITKTGPKTVTLAEFGGSPTSDMGGGAGDGTTTTATIPPKQNGGGCLSDDDCTEANGFLSGLCCYATEYKGYSCAGRCMMSENLNRDACKHPAACALDPWIVKDENICLSKRVGASLAPDLYCKKTFAMEGTINIKALCCPILTPCYGYCLNGGSYDCNDPGACQEESQISVTTPTGEEL